MNASEPYKPPQSDVEKKQNERDIIRGLDVYDSWIDKFLAIEKAGGLNFDPKKLEKSMRSSITFNLWAFFFGPIYYLIKGLWKQVITYMLIALALGILLAVIDAPDYIFHGVSIGTSVAFATRANISYYKRKVHRITPWF